MSDYRLAESLKTLRSQVNALFPNRDKTSDGWIGDAKHASRKSDHNPWVKDGKMGIVTALDIDEDLAPNINSIESIVKSIQASRDPRVKYIIYEGRITVKGDITKWKDYSGVNPHRHHAHISVHSDKRLYDSTAEWSIGNATPNATVPVPPPAVQPNGVPQFTLLKMGDKGVAVTALQARLVQLNYLEVDDIDGDFGGRTRSAVQKFQTSKGLDADGKVGNDTRKALGI